jgi:hypothetical protein
MAAVDAVVIELVEAIPADRIVGHQVTSAALQPSLTRPAAMLALDPPIAPSSKGLRVRVRVPGGIGRQIHADPADDQEIPGLDAVARSCPHPRAHWV